MRSGSRGERADRKAHEYAQIPLPREMLHEIHHGIASEEEYRERQAEELEAGFLHAEIHLPHRSREQQKDEQVEENVAVFHEITQGEKPYEQRYEKNCGYCPFQHKSV